MNKKLATKINAFLKDRKKSDTGDWPDVDQKDVNALNDIVRDLIAAKWDADYGGSRPVVFSGAINRKKYLRLPWHDVMHEPFPETHTRKDLHDWCRAVSANLQIAAHAAQNLEEVVKSFDVKPDYD